MQFAKLKPKVVKTFPPSPFPRPNCFRPLSVALSVTAIISAAWENFLLTMPNDENNDDDDDDDEDEDEGGGYGYGEG